HLVEAAGLQYPVSRQRLEVARPGVLRQIADRLVALNPARGRLGLAGKHSEQRGLACPVPADEADLVARGDVERDMLSKQPRSSAQFKVGDRDHRNPLALKML